MPRLGTPRQLLQARGPGGSRAARSAGSGYMAESAKTGESTGDGAEVVLEYQATALPFCDDLSFTLRRPALMMHVTRPAAPAPISLLLGRDGQVQKQGQPFLRCPRRAPAGRLLQLAGLRSPGTALASSPQKCRQASKGDGVTASAIPVINEKRFTG